MAVDYIFATSILLNMASKIITPKTELTYRSIEALLAANRCKPRQRKAAPTDHECNICYDLEAQQVRIPCCNRLCGLICLDKWLKEQDSHHCPYCRQQLLKRPTSAALRVRARVQELVDMVPAEEWQDFRQQLSSFELWVLDYRARGLDPRFNLWLHTTPRSAKHLVLYMSSPHGEDRRLLLRVWEGSGLAGCHHVGPVWRGLRKVREAAVKTAGFVLGAYGFKRERTFSRGGHGKT
ncbi:uncharacterized protein LTR77_000423 [Saxophila tyrrhenica]|uniref:RING-type domain-containing protein n=1 Tax=Saxophila tyrrhenica TaxID=1690608 RepID=A0AAV9PR91_9PEZI|nr:hypothetical protein LTR77_000423 [Saxophila tyrrhenica]